jgi:transposase
MNSGAAAMHPRVQLHFTPTYSSWLNQVEIWFAKIERDVNARGINSYSANARPIQWKYSNPIRRARGNDLTATGH